jgi:ubiquinone/menaquinone biosynthesis C-methylase UbiE
MTGHATAKEHEADRWFRQRVERFLRRIGVRECQQVADIGCHNGLFTIPAACIVGSCGTVYAIDKDKDALANMKGRIKKESRQNIKVIKADLAGGAFALLERETIDLVLLYDVLHRGYLPEKPERRNMLQHVYRILKAGGILSCFPTHLKKYGFTFEELLGEIGDVGFALEEETWSRIVHDGKLVRGRIFRFSKL